MADVINAATLLHRVEAVISSGEAKHVLANFSEGVRHFQIGLQFVERGIERLQAIEEAINPTPPSPTPQKPR